MVDHKQKKQMMDYLVSKLELANLGVTPKTKELLSGIKSSYIIIGEKDSGIVLLVDQEYPKDSFPKFFQSAKSRFKDVASVIFKDGKIFFRNAAEKNYFKKNKWLSLKHYSNYEMNRMIALRPEEIFLNSQREWLQYFQPESPRLREGLESFKFEPVTFDYDHIDSYERFKPENRDSKRLYIWRENRVHDETGLKIIKGILVSNKDS